MKIETTRQLFTREGRAFKAVNGNIDEFLKVSGNEDASLPGSVISGAYDLTRSFIRIAENLLVNSDRAFRDNRKYQRMMRHDPDVMGPLLQRQYATALMDWDIVPEDETDETQVEQADTLKTLLTHNLNRQIDLHRQLLEAVWYGPAAANVIYKRTDRGIAPVQWIPFHPDSLLFDSEGGLGLKVSRKFEGDTVHGWFGPVRMLDERERAATVLHTFHVQAPDYEEPFESAYMYAGRGLRDTVWYQWMVKQTVLQLWVTYAERYAMGIRVGTYEDGNAAQKSDMETLLANLTSDVSVVFPKNAGEGFDQQANTLRILEPGAARQQIFADLIEGYLAGQIKELIIGQTATTEATATGLGSDVGTRHAETFGRIVKFDALCLAETMTKELVQPMSVMNFGDTPYRPRFEFAVEDVDSEKWMAGVEKYVELGGQVGGRQVAQRLGIDEPAEDEELLSRGADDFDFGGGFGALDFQRVSRFRKAVTDGRSD